MLTPDDHDQEHPVRAAAPVNAQEELTVSPTKSEFVAPLAIASVTSALNSAIVANDASVAPLVVAAQRLAAVACERVPP